MYNNYEEYIRSILGYNTKPIMPQNENCNCQYMNFNEPRQVREDMYPPIYKVIYPMVRKACEMNADISDEEKIDKIADEIYFTIEDNSINEEINIDNNITINNNRTENMNRSMSKEKVNKEEISYARENRNSKSNNYLRDLIKILIIRELLQRPNNNFPMRPPMRSPIMPRSYQSLYDIYEY